MDVAQMSMMRSFRRDPDVTAKKLAPGTWQRIFRFAAPYRRQLLGFLVVIVVAAVAGVAQPLIFKKIIDDGIGTAPPETGRPGLVLGLALLVAGLALFDAVLSLINRWYSARIGEGLIYDLRSQVYAHVQQMPIAFFTRTQTGALITRLNNDVLGAQQAFTGTLSNVVSNAIGVVLTLVAMVVLSWQITLLSLVLLPLFVVPARLVGARLQELTRESYALNAEMNTTMTERFNVSGALLVKLFGRPDREERAFRDKAGRVRDIGITSAMYGRIFFVSLTTVASLATALVYGVGGTFAARGTLQVGTVVALAAYLTRLYGPLTALSNVRVDVMTALVSFERVFEVLDLEPMVAEKPDAVPLPAGAASVELDDVRFGYPTADEVSLASLESVAVLDKTVPAEVLHGVSFRAEPGELVALVGPSGAGKTTISQLVTRMYDVRGGAVRIAGHDVRDVTLQSLRDVVGVVTQDAHMFHDTIRANLLYAAPDATDGRAVAGARRRAGRRRWSAALPDGLDTVVGDRGYRLSGGEKQRMAIARLLLKAPGVVVLDEATAHLDSESEAAVQQALKTALTGRTSLVIAHRLSTVRDADQILVLDEGRVVEHGRHEELLADGRALRRAVPHAVRAAGRRRGAGAERRRLSASGSRPQPASVPSDTRSAGSGVPVTSGDGAAVGSGAGVSVGSGVGVPVGSGLGLSVGSGLGLSVGSGVGVPVGSGLGLSVGSGSGLSAGSGSGAGSGSAGGRHRDLRGGGRRLGQRRRRRCGHRCLGLGRGQDGRQRGVRDRRQRRDVRRQDGRHLGRGSDLRLRGGARRRGRHRGGLVRVRHLEGRDGGDDGRGGGLGGAGEGAERRGGAHAAHRRQSHPAGHRAADGADAPPRPPLRALTRRGLSRRRPLARQQHERVAGVVAGEQATGRQGRRQGSRDPEDEDHHSRAQAGHLPMMDPRRRTCAGHAASCGGAASET